MISLQAAFSRHWQGRCRTGLSVMLQQKRKPKSVIDTDEPSVFWICQSQMKGDAPVRDEIATSDQARSPLAARMSEVDVPLRFAGGSMPCVDCLDAGSCCRGIAFRAALARVTAGSPGLAIGQVFCFVRFVVSKGSVG
jgi:hypothetical protein